MAKAIPVIPNHDNDQISLDYYIRENKDDVNISPAMSLYDAVKQARKASEINDYGLMEVITYLGTRDGDPKFTPESIRVVYIFRRGKLLLSGTPAQIASEKMIPPSV